MGIDAPRLLKAIAIGLGMLAGLAALIELARPMGTWHGTPTTAAGALHDAQDGCRHLSPAQYAADTECRAAWHAARRHFFGLPAEPIETE